MDGWIANSFYIFSFFFGFMLHITITSTGFIYLSVYFHIFPSHHFVS